ncbi:hypothetical protein DFH09DRAFT_1337614 [Mycena vulgaris]|nr:hypothetical protein DFH09DRAFT_1337614 [Mycena vulgaris]
MVLKLYSVPFAADGCGIVALVLAERQIPFELLPIDMAAKHHKTADYLAKHPWGQVPMIVRPFPRPRAEPRDLPLPRREAASVEFANFNPQALKLLLQTVVKTRQGLPIDEAAAATATAELSATLDMYEVILGKQKFLAGDVRFLRVLQAYPYLSQDSP